jgi:hypothetical protein
VSLTNWYLQIYSKLMIQESAGHQSILTPYLGIFGRPVWCALHTGLSRLQHGSSSL